jgi:hypothetical protein
VPEPAPATIPSADQGVLRKENYKGKPKKRKRKNKKEKDKKKKK